MHQKQSKRAQNGKKFCSSTSLSSTLKYTSTHIKVCAHYCPLSLYIASLILPFPTLDLFLNKGSLRPGIAMSSVQLYGIAPLCVYVELLLWWYMNWYFWASHSLWYFPASVPVACPSQSLNLLSLDFWRMAEFALECYSCYPGVCCLNISPEKQS